jgi:hypothetical protein
MSWYNDNASDIASGALLALAFLGVLVTFVRNLVNREPAKWAFAIVFLVIAGIAWHANRTDRRIFESNLMGGDNFAFVRVTDTLTADGQYLINIVPTGALPSLFVGFYPDETTDEFKAHWLTSGPIPHSAFTPSIALRPGRYRIDFWMGNKKWIEHLEFEPVGKTISQKFVVQRDGIEIHREPNP